jgi:CMP-N,N'-diacetyllegionaminic acid synthase
VIGDCTIVGVITARGGSKGIPGKNLVKLAGKPLIAHTVEAALGSKYIDRLIISSDDSAIVEAARGAGCEVPFIRPEELAEDDTPHATVINHALATLEVNYDYFVLLQPTSPLRSSADIDACIERCHDMEAPVAVSVTKFETNPGIIVGLDDNFRLQSLFDPSAPEIRRQDSPAFILNGAVYTCRCEWWRKNQKFICDQTVAHVMPAERSIDIDTLEDLRLAEDQLRQGNTHG